MIVGGLNEHLALGGSCLGFLSAQYQGLPVAIHERLVELFTFHHKLFVEFLNIQVEIWICRSQ